MKNTNNAAHSALIHAIRCVTYAAIQTGILPRSEIARVLRDEANIVKSGRENDKIERDVLCCPKCGGSGVREVEGPMDIPIMYRCDCEKGN